MLQYILNTTAVWLLGLIAFDMLLRRQAHHNYNRLYLLVILLAGALVPLWSWSYDSVIYATGISKPIARQTAVVKESIVTNTGIQLMGWEDLLEWIYVIGLFISASLFIKDIVLIGWLYYRGKKSKDGVWEIVETGKKGVPFSAFRCVFISNRSDYEQEELEMILAHEQYHGHLLHVADVLLARVMLVIFWYNPIVYLLEKRLRMVHEYQVDASLEVDNSVYSRFLVEQSILNAAPRFAHALTSSPLKNRLVMLARKNNRMFSGRQLVIVPVIIIALLCFTQNAFSGGKPEKEGNKITYKGNVFETKEYPPDTTIILDPVTGKENMIVARLEVPDKVVKMNGENVIEATETQNNLEVRNAYTKIKSQVGEALNPLIVKLPVGNYKYDLYNIIIDKQGNIVYYELGGIEEVIIRFGGGKEPVAKTEIDKKVKADMDNAISQVMNKITVGPISMDKQLKICALRIQEHFSVE